MGREIRRVPANWDHPVTKDAYGRDRRQPMFDRTFADAAAEWLADFDRIRAGEVSEYEAKAYPLGVCEWATHNSAPDPTYYRPWADADATWFQLWETVSEGTPVSPPFSSKDELAAYLGEHGDFWDQRRCQTADWVTLWGGTLGVSGWGRERAERFVNGPGWAPSMVVTVGGKVMSGVEAVTTTP